MYKEFEITKWNSNMKMHYSLISAIDIKNVWIKYTILNNVQLIPPVELIITQLVSSGYMFSFPPHSNTQIITWYSDQKYIEN